MKPLNLISTTESTNETSRGPAILQPCNETKCVTCFEQRGCMYEQFLYIAILNLEESRREAQVHQAAVSLGKRA